MFRRSIVSTPAHPAGASPIRPSLGPEFGYGPISASPSVEADRANTGVPGDTSIDILADDYGDTSLDDPAIAKLLAQGRAIAAGRPVLRF